MKDWQSIAADPRYRELTHSRGRLAWTLTAIILIAFFGFILLVAFDKPFLARPVGDGVTSLGIPIAIGVILLGFALTAFYVRHANRHYDAMIRELLEEQE